MLKLLRAPIATTFFSLLFLIGAPGLVHAQTAPTNDIYPFFVSGTEKAKEYFEACKAGMSTPLNLSCTYSADGIDTRCSVAAAGWDCTFTAQSDGSRVLADKNLIVGSKFINYNSAGVEVGTRDTGFGGDTGTGVGAANLSAASCSEGSLSSCIRNLPGMLFAGLGFVFLTISGVILFLAGTVFNWVVLRTVFQFGEYFGTSEGMLIAWGVMRDIANIGLLFGFILMGVLLILNVDGGGHGHGHGGGISAKKAIPRLIIFAVLLNFSLFASQFVIDIANAFGSSFTVLAGQEECSAAVTGAEGNPAESQTLEECATNTGISAKIIHAAGLTNIFGDGRGDLGAMLTNIQDRPYTYATSLILLSIFVLVTALVLLAGAIMLAIRVVVLSFLMVTSPVGFAGMVIPGLSNIASKWWHMLISQSFFAPVYLLLIFISIKLTEGLMGDGANLTNAIIGNAGTGVSGNMQVVMIYIIVIGFMIASLIAASKMGAMGASFASNAASAVVFGAAARGTNFAIGGGSRYLRGRIQGSKFGDTAAGRVLVNRGLRPLEKANLDMRNIPGVAGGLGAAGISAGAKAAEHATYGDTVHQFADIRAGKGSKALTAQYEQERNMDALDAAHGDLTPENEAFLKTMGVKDLAKLHSIQEANAGTVGKLSGAQFDGLMKSDALTDDQKGALKQARVNALVGMAASMSPDDFESAFKNSNFDSADKSALKKARFGLLMSALSSGNTNEVERLAKSLSKKDIDMLPTEVVMANAFRDALSDKQRDDFIASGSRTAAEKEAVKSSYTYAKINAEFNAANGGEVAGANAAARIGSLSPAQAAKLHADILTHPQASGALSPAVLAKILDEGKLTVEQMRTIGTNIRNNPVAMSNPQVKAYMEGAGGALW